MNETTPEAPPTETKPEPKPEVERKPKQVKKKAKPAMKAKPKKAKAKAGKTAKNKTHPILKGVVIRAKSKTRARTKGKKNTRDKITVNFKIAPSEAKAIKLKADKLTKGNVTQMVRLAVLAWKPSKKSLSNIRKSTRT